MQLSSLFLSDRPYRKRPRVMDRRRQCNNCTDDIADGAKRPGIVCALLETERMTHSDGTHDSAVRERLLRWDAGQTGKQGMLRLMRRRLLARVHAVPAWLQAEVSVLDSLDAG